MEVMKWVEITQVKGNHGSIMENCNQSGNIISLQFIDNCIHTIQLLIYTAVWVPIYIIQLSNFVTFQTPFLPDSSQAKNKHYSWWYSLSSWFDWNKCTDKHNCLKSEGGQIHLNFVTVKWLPWNSRDITNRCYGNLFHKEHALAYPNHSFISFGSPLALTPATVSTKCYVKTGCETAGSHFELQYT